MQRGKFSTKDYLNNIIKEAHGRGNKVAYCVIYLSSQDYHRFHSCVQFEAFFRRHIAGYLELVRPSYLAENKHVLKNNERVNIIGEWAKGFFAYSAIGALNLGSIKVHFDQGLQTNNFS